MPARMIYDRRENTCGIWSDTVGTEFNEVRLLKPPAEPTPPSPAPPKK